MNSRLLLAYGLWGGLWGMLLGLFYFGGLWLTVRSIQKVKRPHLLLLLSFLLRFSVAAMCITLIVRLNSPVLWPTLVSFFVTRLVIVRRLGTPSRRGGYAN